MEGPLKQPAAVKNFTKKFQDKTKNKWENRSKFVAAKGKYTLVAEESKSSTSDVSSGAADTIIFNYHVPDLSKTMRLD